MNNTGGPAFPSPFVMELNQGLTIRDYFAAKAMQGLIERGFTEFGNRESAYTNLAYIYADAMLKAREA